MPLSFISGRGNLQDVIFRLEALKNDCSINEIMNFDDAAFESYKRIIDNTKVANTAAGVVKTASVNKALAVGMNTGEDKSFQEELDDLDWH